MVSCHQNYTPKSNAYFRIDFPKKEYQLFDSICPFKFDYPIYGNIRLNDSCWINIQFPKYRGTIYLTYKHINNNLDQLIEDSWTIT